MEFVIDAPPELTGDYAADIAALREHIIELQDELEYTFKRRLENEKQSG